MAVETKGLEKKEEILKIGLEVIWVKGYNDTSVNDIVKACGIPKGSFYYYFDSKEAFAVEALDTYISYLKNIITQALDSVSSLSPIERLKALIDKKIEFIKNDQCYGNGCFMFNMSSEMASRSEEIRKAIYKHQNDIYAIMEKEIQAAIDAGEIKNATAKELVSVIDYAWHGAIGVYKTNQDPSTFVELKNVLINKILT